MRKVAGEKFDRIIRYTLDEKPQRAVGSQMLSALPNPASVGRLPKTEDNFDDDHFYENIPIDNVPF